MFLYVLVPEGGFSSIIVVWPIKFNWKGFWGRVGWTGELADEPQMVDQNSAVSS